ncbi:hypothetical protein Lepto7375DRAFT_7420 [Leptolyngbya sp. PCC 7375]|nr:hypothetical protein Lepto7375DRAFT_7420 [Leptolyngbya sp. PCC 7375]
MKRTIQAIVLACAVSMQSAVWAQTVEIHHRRPSGGIAMCWIDFDGNGVFTGGLYCKDLGIGTPPQNARWVEDRNDLLVPGGVQHIQDRERGQAGRAICYRKYNRTGQFYTNAYCYRGLGGAG